MHHFVSTFFPLNKTCIFGGDISPHIISTKVDFPDPDGPKIISFSPAENERLTSFSISFSSTEKLISKSFKVSNLSECLFETFSNCFE